MLLNKVNLPWLKYAVNIVRPPVDILGIAVAFIAKFNSLQIHASGWVGPSARLVLVRWPYAWHHWTKLTIILGQKWSLKVLMHTVNWKLSCLKRIRQSHVLLSIYTIWCELGVKVVMPDLVGLCLGPHENMKTKVRKTSLGADPKDPWRDFIRPRCFQAGCSRQWWCWLGAGRTRRVKILFVLKRKGTGWKRFFP